MLYHGNDTLTDANTVRRPKSNRPEWPTLLSIRADSAAELMTPAPVHAYAEASVKQAAILMVDHKISALPVLDDEGGLVGVISQSDIVRYERERNEAPSTIIINLNTMGEPESIDDFRLSGDSSVTVRQVMTPVVFSVTPDASPAVVIDQMITHEIQRVFVVDDRDRLVGIISAFDIIRHMRI
ncbi:MAG: CBS domain-containing protein [Myxococcota bacterium]